MPVLHAHGAVQWNSADGVGTTYTISGLSFQPKALRFYWTGIGSAVDAASQTTHSRRGIGFAVGTAARRAVGSQDQDAAGSAVCTSGWRDDCVAFTLTSTPATDGRLDLDAILSDGFRLIVDDAAPVNITVFWDAWGGNDIEVAEVLDIAEPAATGLQSYSVPGFEPNPRDNPLDQVVMLAGVQYTGSVNGQARADSGLCVGFTTGFGEGAVVVGNSDDASGTMDTDGYCRRIECLAMITIAGGNPNARAQLGTSTADDFITDGFQLNWIARATTNRRYIALAMKGGKWRSGFYTISTIFPTTTVLTPDLQPKGILLIGRMTAEQAAGSSSANDRIGMGGGTSPTSRRSQGVLSENGTGSAEIDHVIEYDQVLAFPSTAGGVAAAYDIDTINLDGFEGFVIAEDIDSGVSSEWQGYLVWGDETPPEQPVTRDAQTSFDYLSGLLPRSARVSAEYADVGRAFGGSLSAISEAPISALPEVQQVEQVSRDAQLPYAAGGQVTREPALPIEMLAAVLREPQLPVDTIGVLLRDAQIPVDTLAQLLRDARLPVETLAAILRDAQLPAAISGAVLRDALLPLEFVGPVTITRDAQLPIETRATPAPVVLGNYIGVVGLVAFGAFSRVYPTPYYTNKAHAMRERPRALPRRRRAREVRAAVISQAVAVRPVRRVLLERLYVPMPARRLAPRVEASFADSAEQDVLSLLLL